MRRFWSDRKGNVAVLFALAVLPVIGGLGAAIDYSMANSYRTDMQKALDSTALALSKLLPMDEMKMNEVGMQYFLASLGHHDLTNLDLDIVPDQGKVTLHATGDYTPKLANLFGATKFEVGARAEAIWSMGKVEVALVLDQSLSMDQSGRIDALRDATLQFLSVIKTAAKKPGDAKVGIVAFDGMVNTGYTYATRPNWVRFDWWDENEGSCDKGGHSNRTACVAHWYCSKSSYSTKTTCQNNGGTWKQANWTIDDKNTHWKGCVYDRHKTDPSNNTIVLDYDVNDTGADSTYLYGHASETVAQRKTKYPAARCYSTTPVQAMTALSENWTTLEARAKALDPTGYTNITIGLTWGWHMLSNTSVFTEGAAYGTADLTKYIILMTDGYNTKNIWKEPNACPTNGPECPDIDPRTSLACTNIKAAGIQVYTVRLINGNETLLKNCATSTSMYYDVKSTADLAGVFSAIGSKIASLHLAK
jgi:Flp pilus assembly protein TadG